MDETNQLKLENNQNIDRLIAAVATMTQDQINACAWAMGAKGMWTKENITAELEGEKF
jgi:hypothetical protein